MLTEKLAQDVADAAEVKLRNVKTATPMTALKRKLFGTDALRNTIGGLAMGGTGLAGMQMLSEQERNHQIDLQNLPILGSNAMGGARSTAPAEPATGVYPSESSIVGRYLGNLEPMDYVNTESWGN